MYMLHVDGAKETENNSYFPNDFKTQTLRLNRNRALSLFSLSFI